jgi:ribosomal subunit interface protein
MARKTSGAATGKAKAAAKAETPVHVAARHVRVPADLLTYAQAKGERLGRFDRRVRQVDVVLGLEGMSAAVEVVAHAGGRVPHVGRAQALDGWMAVDLAFGKVTEQVKRNKERRMDRRQRRERS